MLGAGQCASSGSTRTPPSSSLRQPWHCCSWSPLSRRRATSASRAPSHCLLPSDPPRVPPRVGRACSRRRPVRACHLSAANRCRRRRPGSGLRPSRPRSRRRAGRPDRPPRHQRPRPRPGGRRKKTILRRPPRPRRPRPLRRRLRRRYRQRSHPFPRSHRFRPSRHSRSLTWSQPCSRAHREIPHVVLMQRTR
jgi:hypothetical protein